MEQDNKKKIKKRKTYKEDSHTDNSFAKAFQMNARRSMNNKRNIMKNNIWYIIFIVLFIGGLFFLLLGEEYQAYILGTKKPDFLSTFQKWGLISLTIGLIGYMCKRIKDKREEKKNHIDVEKNQSDISLLKYTIISSSYVVLGILSNGFYDFIHKVYIGYLLDIVLVPLFIFIVPFSALYFIIEHMHFNLLRQISNSNISLYEGIAITLSGIAIFVSITAIIFG